MTANAQDGDPADDGRTGDAAVAGDARLAEAVKEAQRLAATAGEIAGQFTGGADELSRAHAVLDQAENAADGYRDILAWLAGARAETWDRWASVADPEGRRVARENAVAARRVAVAGTPGHSPARPVRLANLAGDLLEQYRDTADRDTLDEAIDLLERVFAETPAEQDAHPIRANSLAAALQMRYEADGDRADLDRSTELLERVTEGGLGGAAATALLLNLSAAYGRRFGASGDSHDLDLAEAADRRALAAGGGIAAMVSLGATLTTQFEAHGDQTKLREAIELLSAAVEGTPAHAPQRPDRLSRLASAVLERGDFITGERADMDMAVRLLQEAADLTPGQATAQPARLCNLAGALRRRAARYGEVADLDRAVAAYEQALRQYPPQGAAIAGYLSNLANGLRDRYHWTGLLADIDRAIGLFAEAAQKVGTAGQQALLKGNLGIAYAERAEQTRDIETQTAAVDVFREAAALTPPTSPMWVRTHAHLAQALCSRFTMARQRQDLDEGLEIASAAVAMLSDHPDAPASPLAAPSTGMAIPDAENAWNALVVCRSELALATGRAEDAQQALAAAQAALANTRPGSPTWAERASNLAVIASDHDLADDAQIRQWFHDAINAAQAVNLPAALYTAGNLALWSEERGNWETAISAHAKALELMERLQRSQVSRRHRERWLSAAAGLPARAALAATRCTIPDAALGISLADRGQAVLLAEALAVRPGSSVAAPAAVTAESSLEPDLMLAEASRLTRNGPLVWLCATTRGGVALLLRGETAVHVPLPGLTSERVTAWTEQLAHARPGHLTPMLRETWSEVMSPVLAACPDARELTLLPLGPVRMLPLHASLTTGTTAGDSDPRHAAAGSSLLDLVRVTYAPNLATLLTADKHSSSPADPVAAIGNPEDVDPVSAGIELAALTARFPQIRLLEHAQATVQLVGELLLSAGVIHLSCHGRVDRDDPAASSLYLADGPLSVRDIHALAARRPYPARLIVLSACETALVGRVLSDEAVSLPVALFELGAVGVIGTLWRVAAESTAIFMDFFYRHWRDDQQSPPEALRRAQHDLRAVTNAQLLDRYPELFAGKAEQISQARRALWMSAPRYSDPYHWAAFVYIGL